MSFCHNALYKFLKKSILFVQNEHEATVLPKLGNILFYNQNILLDRWKCFRKQKTPKLNVVKKIVWICRKTFLSNSNDFFTPVNFRTNRKQKLSENKLRKAGEKLKSGCKMVKNE